MNHLQPGGPHFTSILRGGKVSRRRRAAATWRSENAKHVAALVSARVWRWVHVRRNLHAKKPGASVSFTRIGKPGTHLRRARIRVRSKRIVGLLLRDRIRACTGRR